MVTESLQQRPLQRPLGHKIFITFAHLERLQPRMISVYFSTILEFAGRKVWWQRDVMWWQATDMDLHGRYLFSHNSQHSQGSPISSLQQPGTAAPFWAGCSRVHRFQPSDVSRLTGIMMNIWVSTEKSRKTEALSRSFRSIISNIH